MFKKLVANLPFNPSLITQVSFYTARLKAERAIRRMSFLFMLAAMLLQMFAVISPPQRSLAASSNHIINGLRTKDDILSAWDAGGSDIPAIYGVFGLTRDDIASLPQQPNSTLFSGDGNDYWTIGRTSLTGYSNVAQKYKNSQVAIQYAGQNSSSTSDDAFVYNRELRAWDIINKSGNTYKAFKGTIKSTNETFWILVDCGNFTKIGKYTPPPPPPPTPTIDAVCSVVGPLVIPADADSVAVTVKIGLPANSSIPRGTPGENGAGLHIGVSTNSVPTTWNKHTPEDLGFTSPDKQTDYVALRDGTEGVGYYEFVWERDGETYRRYYVTDTHSSSFDVKLNVKINQADKKLVVRLLDREKGQWLPHNSACEVPITREVPPEIKVLKTIVDRKPSLKPGDTLTYLIQYRNTINASIAEDVVITDQLATNYFDVVSTSPAGIPISSTGFLEYPVGDLAFDTNYKSISVTVKLRDQISSGTQVCNASRITASNALADETEPICTSIITPCPYDETVPDINNSNCSQPIVACDAIDYAINRTTRKATFRTTATSTNPATTKIVKYTYDFGDNTPVLVQPSTAFTDEASHTFAAGEFDIKVVVTYTAKGVEGEQESQPCPATINFEEDQAVGQAKTVRNITKDKTGQAAVETIVQGNDVLEYSLTTSNAQNYERVGIEVSDYIGDILDYATLDTAFLEKQGGAYDEATKKIIWRDVKIPANGQVLHTFQVKIKDPIPSTNAPSSVTTGFDCKISNEYGNEITININCPLVKGIEKLPNTGPGSSLVMTVGITMLIGYFFSRSRLLAKEMDIVRHDYATSGGM